MLSDRAVHGVNGGESRNTPASSCGGLIVGVLRLRGCFASRNSHCAQDDKAVGIYIGN